MARITTSPARSLGASARVHAGGDGPPLVLVHGGWGGAAMHWSTVWEALADRFTVIAPELPGVGDASAPLPTLAAYARWLDALLVERGVARAACVGNSFGASVACALAALRPERVGALVLVNGFPMPATPWGLRLAGALLPARRVIGAVLRRAVYSDGAVARAFVDASKVPPALREVVAARAPRAVDALAALYVAGGLDAPPPRGAWLVWGEDDRLPGTSRRDLDRIARSLPDARVVRIARAGHLPQVEQPAAFVAALAPLAGAPR